MLKEYICSFTKTCKTNLQFKTNFTNAWVEKRGKKSKWITCTVEGRKRIGKNRLKRLSHTVLCTCTKKSLTILSENANGTILAKKY